MKFKIGDRVKLKEYEPVLNIDEGTLATIIRYSTKTEIDIKWDNDNIEGDGIGIRWSEYMFDLVKPFKYKSYIQYIKGLLR